MQTQLARTTRLAAAALLAAVAACSTEVIYSNAGYAADTDGFGISAGGVDVRAGRAQVLYGTHRCPAEGRRLSYLVVLPPDVGDGNHQDLSWNGQSKSAPPDLEASSVFRWNEVEVAMEQQLVADEEAGTFTSETLNLGGVERDPAAGRVFLLDTSDEPDSLRQLAVELPGLPDDIEDAPDAIDALADQLTKLSPEIAAFLER